MGVTGWRTTLTWRQFRTVARPLGVNQDAQTRGSIDPPVRVAVAKDGDQFKLSNFDVRVSLVSGETWVVSGKSTPSLLSHEQGHWDITGLTAWEYYRGLAGLRAADPADLSQQASDLLQKMSTKSDDLQIKYDRETDHSRNTADQARWDRVIADAIRGGNAALPDP